MLMALLLDQETLICQWAIRPVKWGAGIYAAQAPALGAAFWGLRVAPTKKGPFSGPLRGSRDDPPEAVNLTSSQAAGDCRCRAL